MEKPGTNVSVNLKPQKVDSPIGRGTLFCIWTSLIPIALAVSPDSDKPIELVVSDLLFFALGLTGLNYLAVCDAKWNKVFVASVVAIVVLLFEGGAGVISSHGSFTSLLSAVRLSKPLLLVFAGLFIFRNTSLDVMSSNFRSAAQSVMAITFASDLLLNSSFPAGRWGGNFLGLPTFGFPNSSVFFLVVLIIIAYPSNVKLFWERVFGNAVCSLGVLWVVMSLSRNGVLSLIVTALIVFATYLIKDKRLVVNVLWALAAISVPLSYFAYFADLGSLLPTEGLLLKIERTLEYEDPTSGRLGLWDFTANLILEKPIFGYLFEPFSHYNHEYATPHSQYLELLYKGGLVGAIVFFAPFWFMFSAANHSRTLCGGSNDFPYKFLIILGVASISSVFQPNFSYSPFANLICFMAGGMAANSKNAKKLLFKAK